MFKNLEKIDDRQFGLDHDAGYSGEIKTLKCKCGNDKFLVGSGEYYTAVKCIKCGIQTCVHEG